VVLCGHPFLNFQLFLSLSIIALLISIYHSQSAIASTTSLHLSQRLIETFDDVGPKKLGRSLDSRFVHCTMRQSHISIASDPKHGNHGLLCRHWHLRAIFWESCKDCRGTANHQFPERCLLALTSIAISMWMFVAYLATTSHHHHTELPPLSCNLQT
jgi:hypothetical protein